MIRMGMSGLQRITVSVVFIRRQAYGTGLLRLFLVRCILHCVK